MHSELKEFLNTGKLGPICSSTRLEEVLELFGEPDYKKEICNPPSFVKELIFNYGGLVLWFEQNQISLYGLSFEDGVQIPQFLNPVGYFPLGGRVPMEEFLNYLVEEQVPFRERKPHEDDFCRVFSKGGVAVEGRSYVGRLMRPCPETERWRRMMNRELYRIAPAKSFGKI